LPAPIAVHLSPQAVTTVFCSFAKLGLRPDAALVSALSERASAASEDFIAQDISKTMWPSPVVVDALMRRAAVINPQNVANLMWALASLGVELTDELVAAMSSTAVRKMWDFNPQNVSNSSGRCDNGAQDRRGTGGGDPRPRGRDIPGLHNA
jgi:hypothetical protein